MFQDHPSEKKNCKCDGLNSGTPINFMGRGGGITIIFKKIKKIKKGKGEEEVQKVGQGEFCLM